MELWRQKLEQINIDEEPISILQKEITGVRSNAKGPDDLFYTEFSESDAQAYFGIFMRFKETLTANRYAVESLEANLKEQIMATTKGINPIEVILYASRCVKEQIYSNDKLIKILIGIVAPRLHYSDCEKIARHILGGWDWLAPIGVFVQAIGACNNGNLIRLAMEYYPRLARLAIDTNEKNIFESYLKMIFSTQNPAYNNYLIDIVTNRYFANDNDLVDKFTVRVKKEKYLNVEPYFSELMSGIMSQTGLPGAFRIKIGKITHKEGKDANAFVANMNSDLSDENKLKEIDNLQFGHCSRKDIAAIKNIREPGAVSIALRRVMECINNIYPEEQRGDAYVLLGTKGSVIRDEIVEFLRLELSANPIYAIPIYIALQELNEVGYSDLLKVIDEAPYKAFLGKNIGNYCRFRTRFLGVTFVPHLCSFFDENLENGSAIKNKLLMLKEILTVYDGRDGKINSDTMLPEQLINLIAIINSAAAERETYDYVLVILDMLRRSCPSKKNKILKQLDIIKAKVKDNADLQSIEFRADAMIRSLDNITAPQ